MQNGSTYWNNDDICQGQTGVTEKKDEVNKGVIWLRVQSTFYCRGTIRVEISKIHIFNHHHERGKHSTRTNTSDNPAICLTLADTQREAGPGLTHWSRRSVSCDSCQLHTEFFIRQSGPQSSGAGTPLLPKCFGFFYECSRINQGEALYRNSCVFCWGDRKNMGLAETTSDLQRWDSTVLYVQYTSSLEYV